MQMTVLTNMVCCNTDLICVLEQLVAIIQYHQFQKQNIEQFTQRTQLSVRSLAFEDFTVNEVSP